MKKASLTEEQKEFFDFFEEKTGFRPNGMDLVSLEGTKAALNVLGLELPIFQKDLWGLLLYCEEKLFFYIHPTEYSYMGIIKKDSKELKIKEQLVCLSDFQTLSFSVPVVRPSFLSIFANKHLFTLSVSKQRGDVIDNAVVQLQSLVKAPVILQRLRAYEHSV
ncbi:MAG: hypothetical protein K5930_10030 [Treponemataceae bacterium]|nr:hypothetical protein [Treponemataceae bacterium]